MAGLSPTSNATLHPAPPVLLVGADEETATSHNSLESIRVSAAFPSFARWL